MKTLVILSVLVLALIGGAAGKKSESLKEQEEKCNSVCREKNIKETTCKASCGLNQKFKSVWIEALQCSLKCNKKHGIGAPDTKICEEGCKKKYEDKVAELALSCTSACSKEEKDKDGVEKCKKICTPSLIYKEMQEEAQAKADKTKKADKAAPV